MKHDSPVLQLRDVHRHFGATAIIRGVNLAVQASERVALIGPNGAGKSTLFNLISGVLAPSAGEIRLMDRPIQGMRPEKIHRLGLARSFQVSSLFEQLSVQENLRCALLWSQRYRYSFWHFLARQPRLNAAVAQWLERLGLQAQRHEAVRHLSYAQQRALELGVTLAGGASVILLDEPTAGMSRDETRHFVALIRQITEGKTLLVVEHDMDVVFGLADRIAVLVQGQIIACDSPAAVRDNPAVQQAYLGTLPPPRDESNGQENHA